MASHLLFLFRHTVRQRGRHLPDGGQCHCDASDEVALIPQPVPFGVAVESGPVTVARTTNRWCNERLVNVWIINIIDFTVCEYVWCSWLSAFFFFDWTVGFAAKGIKNMLLIPISFVNEHIETLHELDIEYCKELASEVSYICFSMKLHTAAKRMSWCLKAVLLDRRHWMGC